MTTKNTGVDSEKEFELRLKRAYGKKCFIYRVTDSKEVRGRTGKAVSTKAQPSDYIITIEGKMSYAEVKSCQNKTSFPFSQISDVQWASSKRQYMAGGDYYFVIHNLNTNNWYTVPAFVFHESEKRSMKWDEMEQYLWRELW